MLENQKTKRLLCFKILKSKKCIQFYFCFEIIVVQFLSQSCNNDGGLKGLNLKSHYFDCFQSLFKLQNIINIFFINLKTNTLQFQINYFLKALLYVFIKTNNIVLNKKCFKLVKTYLSISAVIFKNSIVLNKFIVTIVSQVNINKKYKRLYKIFTYNSLVT